MRFVLCNSQRPNPPPSFGNPEPLNSTQNFPYDVDFFNWAVSGTWDLLYSSSRISVPDPNVRVRNIQAVYDGETSTFRHLVSWEFEESAADSQQVQKAKIFSP